MVARIQNTYCRLNRAKGEDLKVEDIKLLIEYPTGLEQSVIGHRCPSDFLTAPRAQMHRGEWGGGCVVALETLWEASSVHSREVISSLNLSLVIES